MKIPIYKLPIFASVVTYDKLIQLILQKVYEDEQTFLYPVIAYKGDIGYTGKFYPQGKTLDDRNICGVVHKFDYFEDSPIIAQIKPIIPNFKLFDDISSTPYLCPLGIMDDENNIAEIIAFQICHL